MIAPALDIIETTMVDAWSDLANDRLTQLGPIPFGAIDRWAVRHGIDDPGEFAFLARAVRAADQSYLAWAADKLSSSSAHPPPPQSRGNGRPQ